MVSEHTVGMLMAFVCVCLVSPDTLLLLIMSSHASPAAALFWKTLTVGSGSLVMGMLSSSGLADSFRAVPLHVLLVVWAVLALTTSGFSLSVLLTTPARAMMFIALNPMWASLMGVWLLGERLPRRTIGAVVISLQSIAIICADRPSGAGPEVNGTVAGDVVAAAAGAAFGAYLTMLRYTTQRYRGVSSGLLSTGGFFLASFCVLLTAPLHGQSLLPAGGLPPAFWAACLLDGALCTTFNAALASASHRISAAELAMTQLLEYVVGPLVVCLAGRSAVPSATVLGGGVLLVTALLLHEAFGVLAERGHPLGKWLDVSLISPADPSTRPADEPGAEGAERRTLLGELSPVGSPQQPPPRSSPETPPSPRRRTSREKAPWEFESHMPSLPEISL